MSDHSTPTTCTAFDGTARIASGPYISVAHALAAHLRRRADASLLIFDDVSGEQIDFDLRGSDEEIARRLRERFPQTGGEGGARTPGRPKLGVVAREVTLLPRHWEWLAAQPGGASVTLRRLVEAARRGGETDQTDSRRRAERTYRFMSAMAGNLRGFEEAARALFANDRARLEKLIARWPADVRTHIQRLCRENAPIA
ncbi:MAG: DUF2239 family protein [Hyphomicrobiales bacterium]|nr:DUF2239 family protein [Hyphomicrobiales bacterium]